MDAYTAHCPVCDKEIAVYTQISDVTIIRDLALCPRCLHILTRSAGSLVWYIFHLDPALLDAHTLLAIAHCRGTSVNP